jgi:hypothetical protein
MTYIICDLKGKIYSATDNLKTAESKTKEISELFNTFLVYFKKIDYLRFKKYKELI